MNKKTFSSVVFPLIFFLTGATALAGHNRNLFPASVYRTLLQAQVAQPAPVMLPKKKKGAGVVKMVNQLMHDGPNSFWRKWENLFRGEEEGPPDEEEIAEGLNLINNVLAQIKALSPTTKKETKAVAKAVKDLEREKKNLNEQLFRVAKLDPLREQMQDFWDNELDGPARLAKLKEMAAAWAALEPEAKKYRHLGNEVGGELENIANHIRNEEENLARQQNQNQEAPPPHEEPAPMPVVMNKMRQNALQQASINQALRRRLRTR